ncbi:hypothetical protein FHL15_001550 [Xylaria flabelliformis]|uniref:Uncharacterized protein n=1 Tax=Xylaria flabelliformis TaxID=2512241 RepID=A0A553IC72_9PEZI|nr:hypothetical protein FHL15_001550 [Xylaria flabelliformis]
MANCPHRFTPPPGDVNDSQPAAQEDYQHDEDEPAKPIIAELGAMPQLSSLEEHQQRNVLNTHRVDEHVGHQKLKWTDPHCVAPYNATYAATLGTTDTAGYRTTMEVNNANLSFIGSDDSDTESGAVYVAKSRGVKYYGKVADESSIAAVDDAITICAFVVISFDIVEDKQHYNSLPTSTHYKEVDRDRDRSKRVASTEVFSTSYSGPLRPFQTNKDDTISPLEAATPRYTAL